MSDRERVMKELSWLINNFPQQKNPEDAADKMCNAINAYCSDALAVLYEQEHENRVLRQLVEWAVECDFGFDNIDKDGLFKKYESEIEKMHNYTESLIWFAGKMMDEQSAMKQANIKTERRT